MTRMRMINQWRWTKRRSCELSASGDIKGEKIEIFTTSGVERFVWVISIEPKIVV